jgi:hypothetical protein
LTIITLIDRLTAHGAREEESEDSEDPEDPGNWKRLPPMLTISRTPKRSRAQMLGVAQSEDNIGDGVTQRSLVGRRKRN